MKEQTILEKAIRLIEGGLVNVDGHCVRLKQTKCDSDICFLCKMDSICKRDSEMMEVCRECDYITYRDCYLELVTNDKKIKQ